MEKHLWKAGFFCFCLLLMSCGHTYRSAIKFYVNAIDKMKPGVRKELTFLQSSSISTGTICEKYFFVPLVKNTFHTNLGSDLLLKGNNRYETFYVYSKTVKRDNKATKDEMTPLVFLNSRLIGKGWVFYDSLFVRQ